MLMSALGGHKPTERHKAVMSGSPLLSGIASAAGQVRAAEILQRLLLVAALLAGEFHPRGAFFRREAVWRAALAADSVDTGIALLHDQRFAFHGFADQALGLLAHRLLRHSLRTCRDLEMRPYST